MKSGAVQLPYSRTFFEFHSNEHWTSKTFKAAKVGVDCTFKGERTSDSQAMREIRSLQHVRKPMFRWTTKASVMIPWPSRNVRHIGCSH